MNLYVEKRDERHKVISILALDLGQSTGWAVHNKDAITSGTKLFKRDYFSGGGVIFVWFDNWLTEMHKSSQGPIDHVFFESVTRHKGTIAAHCYGGFMATLQRWCELHTIPYEGVHVQTIKAFWCGTGGASKQQMILEARKRGFTCSADEDDKADALAILHYGLKKNGVIH